MGGGISVHLSDLHHGAAGHGSRARPFRAPAQLDRVVHHNIPLEQDRGGHERVALSTETHEAHSVYFMQGGRGGSERVSPGFSRERNKTVTTVYGCKKKEGGEKKHYTAALDTEYDGLLTFEKASFTRIAANFQLHNKT